MPLSTLSGVLSGRQLTKEFIMNNSMKLRTKLGVVAAGLVGVTASANAALSPTVEAAFTSVGSDASAMGELAWPIVVGITLTIVGIGLFKKFIGKAAS